MKLTDQKVAKALGWVHKYPCSGRKCEWRKPGSVGLHKMPPFTTSLDAIVAEIEARELYWSVVKSWDGESYQASVARKQTTILCSRLAPHGVESPALALCAALLHFLKDSHDPA